MVNLTVYKKKSLSLVMVWIEKSPLGNAVCHHFAGLVMPISDPDDRFFYPHHIPIEDTYIVVHVPILFYAVKFSEYLDWFSPLIATAYRSHGVDNSGTSLVNI